MNRKWLFAGVAGLLVLFAVLALVVGGVVGRSIVPKAVSPARPATVRFADSLTDVAIFYPATWVRRQPHDQRVRIVVAAPDGSAGARVSVRPSGLEEPVTVQNLPVVRKLLIDDLLAADRNIVTPIPEPAVVTVGGLPGLKYTYVFRRSDGTDGANVHYFLFKDARLVQLVLQAVPASRLQALEPTFQQIADTFEGNRR